MPVTVHKILVHSVDIIQTALLPIGQLSEEAQEARNKDCRRFREDNTRKRPRIATNTDLINMLLITSILYLIASGIFCERKRDLFLPKF